MQMRIAVFFFTIIIVVIYRCLGEKPHLWREVEVSVSLAEVTSVFRQGPEYQSAYSVALHIT